MHPLLGQDRTQSVGHVLLLEPRLDLVRQFHALTEVENG